MVGNVPVGNMAPIAVQSMTNTPTPDVDATVSQIERLQNAGCEIIRLAIPDAESARAISGDSGLLDIEALAAYARETLADFKRPRGIDVWPELPKSAANKILRREVRDKLVAQGSPGR